MSKSHNCHPDRRRDPCLPACLPACLPVGRVGKVCLLSENIGQRFLAVAQNDNLATVPKFRN